MKKIILTLIIGIALMSFTEVKAQPFIYFNEQIADTIYGPLKKVVRYNILTNLVEDFLPLQTISKNVTSIFDPSQTYLIVYHHRQGYRLYNCANISTNYDLGIWGSQIEGVLYLSSNNTLYIFSDEYKNLSAFNFSTNSISSEIILGKTGYDNGLMEPKICAFFSYDHSKIYFYNIDSSDHEQVWVYSIETDQIISKRNLNEIGYANADGHDLRFGKNGKGIVSSYPLYNNPVKDFYYRIYDFDNNTGSNDIYHNGLSEAYFANNGEVLLIMNTSKDDTLNYYHTGQGYLYSSQSGQLLKTLNLPANGKIYTFDNYPNNIYYVKDIELPTRQIYTLKMDSLFNVLDLTSLSPSSKIVNSPPFTLTVNGHGFDTLSTVYFNGGAKTTTYVNDSVLTASISTSDISVVGNYPVWVTDEWGTSDTLMFAVNPPPPDLNKISPSLALPYDPLFGLEHFTVTVTGNNFTSSSEAYFNGVAKTTTFVSDSIVTFQLSSFNVGRNPYTAPVWIQNSGVKSDTLIFAVVTTLPQPITPILECVRTNSSTSYTAFFGYNNRNNAGVFITAGGTKNFFSPGQNSGQPNIFLPGLQTNVFSVNFSGSTITWTLNGIRVTASKKSPACP